MPNLRAGLLVSSGVLFGACVFNVIKRDALTLSLFRVTGDWGEVFFLPLMVLPIVAVLGALGGLVGKSFGGMSRASVQY